MHLMRERLGQNKQTGHCVDLMTLASDLFENKQRGNY